MASTKESVLLITRRGSVLLSRSDAGGRIDFGSQSASGRKIPKHSSAGADIEMSRTSRTGKPSVHGSTTSSGSGAEIDTSRSSNVEGGSRTGRVGGSLFTPRRTSDAARVGSKPRHTSVNETGLASMVPARLSYSPPLAALPAEEKGETLVRDENNHGDSAEASRTADDHLAHPFRVKRRHSTAEQSNRRAFNGPPTTETGLEDSTGSGEQPQLRWRPAQRGVATGAQLEGSGGNRARRQPQGENGGEGGGENRTTASKIGNMLAELPLSKLKIVIGKCSHGEQTTLSDCVGHNGMCPVGNQTDCLAYVAV